MAGADSFLKTDLCWIDDIVEITFKGQPFPERRSVPTLSDAEAFTNQVVGDNSSQSHMSQFP